jgi:hypothetical protein
MSGDECHEEPGEFDSKAGVLCNNIVSELLGTQELCRSMRKLLSPPISGRTGLLVVNGVVTKICFKDFHRLVDSDKYQ